LTSYPDISFLFSLYLPDANTRAAEQEYRSSQPSLTFTPFNEVELITAFEARIFRREMRPSQIRAAFRLLQADIDAGVLVRKPVPQSVYERAIELSRRHTRRIGARALDILHVAIALELGAEVFFTFDRRQHRLARAAGLRIRPTP
jgi:predicted nucleic acid-binding protein